MFTILKGHVSPETAYIVNNYPFGFRLRCKIRYWLEYKPKLGFRFMSQTTNPKRPGEVWNKPKASTYSRFGACMYLDDKGHVQHTGAHEYMDGKELAAWLETYGEGVPEEGQLLLRKWAASKVTYDTTQTQAFDPVALQAARKAFVETK